jgi:hypothetical protein
MGACQIDRETPWTQRNRQMKRYASILMTVFGILAVALACASCSHDIPIYPGATRIDAADDPIASALVESMEELAAKDVSADADSRVYALPSGSTWQEVRDFYTVEMKDTEWKPAADLTIDAGDYHMVGWARPGQALSVVYAPRGASRPPLMLIMLATEK